LRLAAFTGLKRILVADQTIEPTHVAGFNQLYDDPDATEYVLYGAGIDQQFTRNLLGGAEVNLRELNVPINDAKNSEEEWDENTYRLYLYWTLNRYFSLGMEYQYELFKKDNLSAGKTPVEIKTDMVPIHLSCSHPSGGFGRVSATYVSQEFQNIEVPGSPDEDIFVLVDMTMGYRLPGRYGILSIEINNLLNRGFNYLEIADRSSQDVVAPPFLPDRSIVFRMTISF
jgi:hypothetical protein